MSSVIQNNNDNQNNENNNLKPSSTLNSGKIKIKFGTEADVMENMRIYPNNTVSTTKYNVLTWLPKSLLFQFLRAANIYFLIISILTTFAFSPKNPLSMIGTFALVLILTMLKEGYEVSSIILLLN